jgi:hypothetical protein
LDRDCLSEDEREAFWMIWCMKNNRGGHKLEVSPWAADKSQSAACGHSARP